MGRINPVLILNDYLANQEELLLKIAH
jgi:hypothetical protein